MVDVSKLAESIRRNPNLNQPGIKVEVVNVDSDLNIGNLLLNKTSATTTTATTNTTTTTNNITAQTDPKKEVVSKENAKYKDTEGTLIRYADGTVAFQVAKSKGDNKTLSVLNFNNDKDFQNQKPVSRVFYKGEQTSNGVRYKKCTEETYKYHMNGKMSHSELKNADGVMLNQADYNKKGKPEKRIVYDKEGNIQSTCKYSYKGDDTQLVEKYDKDNKLLFRTTVKYNGDKRVSAQSTYPNGQLAAEMTYDENGKLQTQKEYYENGQLKADTVFYDNGVIKTQKLYDENGKVTKTITDEIDGNFDSSAQKLQGDCYLMSSINAIRQTEDGLKALSNLVKTTKNENGEKVYTVTFPGAKLAAEGLQKDSRIKPGTCAITGTYTFTESEMKEILKQAGIKYSIGDGDVILLEAAFEKYRQEVNATLKANDIDPKSISPDQAGLYTGKDENNILSGGYTEDAVFILTGKQSEVYNNNKPQNGVSLADLQAGKFTPVAMPGAKNISAEAKAPSSIEGKPSNNISKVDEMLDEIMKDCEDGQVDNIMTASFKTVDSNGGVGGHALTIKSVTADTVVLENPWHPDQDLVVSREDFRKCVSHMTLASENTNQPGNNNNNLPPHIIELINQIQHINSNNNNNNTGNVSQPQGNTGNTPPTSLGTYPIPSGISYTNMIISMLKKQGINPTKENIRIAKEQFEALNPGAVVPYRGKVQKWHGNKMVYAGSTVKIPKFTMNNG